MVRLLGPGRAHSRKTPLSSKPTPLYLCAILRLAPSPRRPTAMGSFFSYLLTPPGRPPDHIALKCHGGTLGNCNQLNGIIWRALFTIRERCSNGIDNNHERDER